MPMKRGSLILLVNLVVALLPMVASGQSYWGSPCIGFPSSSVQPTIYIGYLFKHKGAGFSFDTNEGNLFTIRDFGHDYDLDGIWAEFAVPVRSSGPLGFAFGAGYLFPFRQRSLEWYSLTTGPGKRSWDADIQLWNLQVAITFNISCSVTAVAGFRYDSLATNFHDPEDQIAVGGSPEDAADFAYSGYLPFLGLTGERIGLFGGALKAGAIGFPALPGAFEYRETIGRGGLPGPGNTARMLAWNEFHSGYFLEAFGEWNFQAYGAQIGAFAKYSMAHGNSTVDLNAQVGAAEAPALVSVQNEFAVSFDRRYWIVGGNVIFNF